MGASSWWPDRGIVRFLAATGRVCAEAALALRGLVAQPAAWRACIAQSAALSYRCALPVLWVTAPIGAMLAVHSLSITRAFGVDRLLPPLVSSTIIREFAPGFAAVMVCFQGGAGIAAELGTMRVQDELAALEVMGVDARAWVFAPRMLGAALATTLLNGLAIVAGLGGAYLVSVGLAGIPHTLFVEGALHGIRVEDLWVSEAKSAWFGGLLGAVSASFGAEAAGGARGVGMAANRAVVTTVIAVLASNYLINTLLLGFGGVPS